MDSATTSAILGVLGSMGTAALGYYLGRREGRRRELQEAYGSWLSALRAFLAEESALVTFDHVEGLKSAHPEVAGITASPSGRNRQQHVRDIQSSRARLDDSRSKVLLVERSDLFAAKIRKLSGLVVDGREADSPSAYGPVFAMIEVHREVRSALDELEENLRKHHPALRRAG